MLFHCSLGSLYFKHKTKSDTLESKFARLRLALLLSFYYYMLLLSSGAVGGMVLTMVGITLCIVSSIGDTPILSSEQNQADATLQ
jgi:hypothetical protein